MGRRGRGAQPPAGPGRPAQGAGPVERRAPGHAAADEEVRRAGTRRRASGQRQRLRAGGQERAGGAAARGRLDLRQRCGRALRRARLAAAFQPAARRDPRRAGARRGGAGPASGQSFAGGLPGPAGGRPGRRARGARQREPGGAAQRRSPADRVHRAEGRPARRGRRRGGPGGARTRRGVRVPARRFGGQRPLPQARADRRRRRTGRGPQARQGQRHAP